ncbi:S8 family peptidase [Bacillus salipaludis]|uniref:S8 family peptidase n=1 Tax=Bacillus salipaludis TaxID=2547811 RepID=UPI002E1AFFFC|nr:S8 family peptidase [Bacillus salipaludis]
MEENKVHRKPNKALLNVVLAASLTMSIPSLLFSEKVKAATGEPEKSVIVLFDKTIDDATIQDANGKVKHRYKNIPAVSMSLPSSKLSKLQKNPKIKAIEEDQIVEAKGKTKTTTSSQVIDWGVKRINAPSSWSKGLTGKGVKISIIDTGITTHEDLMVSGGISTVSYTKSYKDDNGHGTFVAGIAGAKNNTKGIEGTAPDSQIYAVKALNASATGSLSDVIEGIDWSISNDMDIINLSLGVDNPSSALEQAVNAAYNANILLVAAAGNDAESLSVDTVDYPAKYDSVIAVGSINNTDTRDSTSSTGDSVEVVAPGAQIYSTYLNNSYKTLSGTSMATPHVSGDLALLKQAYPLATNAELRLKLRENAIDLGSVGKDIQYGYGLIQTP